MLKAFYCMEFAVYRYVVGGSGVAVELLQLAHQHVQHSV